MIRKEKQYIFDFLLYQIKTTEAYIKNNNLNKSKIK